MESALYYKTSSIKMVKGEGIYLYDENGNSYIDCASATFNLSLGYSHPTVIDAMKNQMDQLIHITSSFQSDPVNALARNLLAVSPAGMTKVHPKVGGGSEAVEGAIKMAQNATGRSQVISLFRSHHGQTIATAAISGNAFRREPFPSQFNGALHVPEPNCANCFYNQKPTSCNLLCVSRVQDFIDYASNGQVAAFIIEPISGNGGNNVPPEGYLNKVRELCDKNGIMLIFDEIQTGIGRTGKMFASEYFNVTPDAITVAKGLGGSGAQVAAIITNKKLEGLDSHHHSFTYGSNLMAAAAANATLEIIKQPEFLANVTRTGDHIMARLRDMKKRFPCIGEVMGVGLMIGFEIIGKPGDDASKLTNYLADVALKYGLVLRTSRYGYGNVIKIRPPLTLTMKDADNICDKLEIMFSKETL